MLMRRPSWWSRNGGLLVLLAAILLIALVAAVLRLWIGPPGPYDGELLVSLVSAEAAALILVLRHVRTDRRHTMPGRRTQSGCPPSERGLVDPEPTACATGEADPGVTVLVGSRGGGARGAG